jgi:transaldolase
MKRGCTTITGGRSIGKRKNADTGAAVMTTRRRYNPLSKLRTFGQSVWLDSINHDLLNSGKLQKIIADNDISGALFNPGTFEEEISNDRYHQEVRQLLSTSADPVEICRSLIVQHAQKVADYLLPVYEQTDGRDGFVSMEVFPEFAYDSEGIIEDAHALWRELDRPNVMIQIPATHEAMRAVRQLTDDGVNVNVTLLLALSRYREASEAYISGLEARRMRSLPIRHVSSVAGFSLASLDQVSDLLLEPNGDSKSKGVQQIRGRIGIATAKIAYQAYSEIFHSKRFLRLASEGARAQRLLWSASDSDNPAAAAMQYLENLVGPATIVALPVEALEVCRYRNEPAPRLQERITEARETLSLLYENSNAADSVLDDLREDIIKREVLLYDHAIDALSGYMPDNR